MFIKYVEFSNYWGKSTHRKSDRKMTFCSWPYSLFDSPNEMWGEGHSRCTKGSGLSRVMSREQSKEEMREWIIGVFLRPTALLIGPEKFIMHQVLPEDRGIPEGFLLMKIQGKILPIQSSWGLRGHSLLMCNCRLRHGRSKKRDHQKVLPKEPRLAVDQRDDKNCLHLVCFVQNSPILDVWDQNILRPYI